MVTPKPTDALAQMAQQLARLEAENKALKEAQTKAGKISLKVSEKGALSVYGMGRFPVTLYAEQWETLLAEGQVKSIKDFIVANKSKFSTKADKLARDEAAKAAGATPAAPVTAPAKGSAL